MTAKRVFALMSVALGLLVAAIIACTYAADIMLNQRAATLSDLKLQHQVLERQTTNLSRAKRDINKYAELGKIAKTIVPQDKDQAEAVREIVKLAGDSGFKPSSISLPASSLGSVTPGKASAAADTKAALTQLKPVKGNSGLYVMEITVTQDSSSPISYSQFIDFLARLEQNRRTALVSSISLQPSATNRNALSFTLTVDKYVKP